MQQQTRYPKPISIRNKKSVDSIKDFGKVNNTPVQDALTSEKGSENTSQITPKIQSAQDLNTTCGLKFNVNHLKLQTDNPLIYKSKRLEEEQKMRQTTMKKQSPQKPKEPIRKKLIQQTQYFKFFSLPSLHQSPQHEEQMSNTIHQQKQIKKRFPQSQNFFKMQQQMSQNNFENYVREFQRKHHQLSHLQQPNQFQNLMQILNTKILLDQVVLQKIQQQPEQAQTQEKYHSLHNIRHRNYQNPNNSQTNFKSSVKQNQPKTDQNFFLKPEKRIVRKSLGSPPPVQTPTDQVPSRYNIFTDDSDMDLSQYLQNLKQKR